MKRFTLFVFLCTIFVCNVLAKDVIITRDSERIDAIVTEISESEVKYKKLDNPNGPTFVLSTSKIASIMYENGDVQTFKQESQQVAQNNSDVQIYNTEPTYDIFGTANYGTVLGEMNAKNIQFVSGLPIVKNGRTYSYGNMYMDENTYAGFIKRTCPTAYQTYRDGRTKVNVGAGFVGAALGSLLSLTIIAACSDFMDVSGAAIGMGVTSGICWITGIPLWVVGAIEKRNSINIFNNQCGKVQNPPITISVNASNNGIGLALNF